jgi:hypothetical protein
MYKLFQASSLTKVEEELLKNVTQCVSENLYFFIIRAKQKKMVDEVLSQLTILKRSSSFHPSGALINSSILRDKEHSFHWNNTFATIHPFVTNYKENG